MMRVASLIEEADDAADLQEEPCTPAPVKTQTEKVYLILMDYLEPLTAMSLYRQFIGFVLG